MKEGNIIRAVIKVLQAIWLYAYDPPYSRSYISLHSTMLKSASCHRLGVVKRVANLWRPVHANALTAGCEGIIYQANFLQPNVIYLIYIINI